MRFLTHASQMNMPNNVLTVKKTINPGKITDSDEDPKFGKKFLAVESGGRLEIHGLEPKVPFTRLATTLHPKVTIVHKSVSMKNSKEILMLSSAQWMAEQLCLLNRRRSNRSAIHCAYDSTPNLLIIGPLTIYLP